MNERSHFTQFGKEASDFVNVTGGIPQSCKLGPIAFVIKINMLPSVIEQVVAQGVNDDVVVDENTILFMHDTTSWKALDVHNHGNISKKIDLVKDSTENEKMELNPEKWYLRNVDRFSKRYRTVIPAIKINDCVLERVSSCKLLGLWIDDDLK